MPPSNMNLEDNGRAEWVRKSDDDNIEYGVSPTQIRRKPSDKNHFKESDAKDDSHVWCLISGVDPSQLPADMISLLSGNRRALSDDFDLPPVPAWLDVERVKKGQAFAQKYFFGVMYSQILALFALLAGGDGLKPLIYTEKSHTPKLAKARYLDSFRHISTWYKSDLWEPTSAGYKSLKDVRAIHITISKRVNSISVDDVHRLSNLEEKLKSSESSWMCPMSAILRKDFDEHKIGPLYPVYEKKDDRIYLNQTEMAMTQLSLFALVLVHPDKFGAKKATREELGDFVHLWRYVGYMLGIEDEYNLCSGDLETVETKSRHALEYIAKPTIMRTGEEWEHMSRSAALGIEEFSRIPITFESTMLYFYWLLDIDTPHLKRSVSWKDWILFNVLKYLLNSKYQIPGTTRFLNFLTRKLIQRTVGKKGSKKN